MSNWGSCSRSNNINLDFRLLFAPQEILDAVILHELAHTKHRNHSREYYSTLLPIMPDNKERLRWLRDNGHKLTVGISRHPTVPNQNRRKKRYALELRASSAELSLCPLLPPLKAVSNECPTTKPT